MPNAEQNTVQPDVPQKIVTETSDSSLVEQKEKKSEPAKKRRAFIVLIVLGILEFLGGLACILFVLLTPKEELPDLVFPEIPSSRSEAAVYSDLTGLPLADANAKNAPAYCIQTPNGTDGARPQVGLTDAGVIFEAIAEAGITRFAAIYQNPSSNVIGPVRSLRIYYLQWDTPFDCTIVHAGGAANAIDAVRQGGYKDLSESYAYMWRGGYGVRRWNNLFTSSQYLRQFSDDAGYTSSNINGFSRMTPSESKKSRIDSGAKKLIITEPTTENTATISPSVTNINIYFGGWPSFNVNYRYNADSNTYARWFETGDPHEVYQCPTEDYGEPNPEDVCNLTQLSPAVVVAMMVNERKADDGYLEDITTIGSGEVHIFQNGTVIHGTWNKGSVGEQIRFYDDAGAEIKLAPGQTFVEAVPGYGGVEY